MTRFRIYRRVVGRLLWLPLAALVMRPATAAVAAERKFDVLETRTGSYTNVTVTKKLEASILVFHARGVASIKIPDLPLDIQQELGYAIRPQKTESSGVSDPANQILAGIALPQVKQVEQTWRRLAPPWVSRVTLSATLLYSVLGFALLSYLVFCYCSMMICRKTHTGPGVMVWVPLLQLFPLLRAAGMSGLWFLAFLVPVLNLLAQIVWSVNIVKACGKSLWVALLLALPVTGPFAFLYLAFSSTTPIAAPVKVEDRPEMMVLESD